MLISRETARSLGKTRFFSGVCCKRDHLCERLVSNGLCLECARLAKNLDRAKNSEREKARKLRYIASLDRDFENSKRRAFYAENKHRIRRKEPEVNAAFAKKWRADNPEKLKRGRDEWRRRNPEILRAHERNRRAREVAANGSHTAQEISELYERQHGKCAACHFKVSFKLKHIDHAVPLARGGRNDIGNLQILCAPCNLSKGVLAPTVWARQLGRLF